jgi:hypothetical protein
MGKSISFLQMISVVVFGVFAQLYMRVVVLEGSLDKLWLMFFCVFPFSIVPALMMYSGAVALGQGGKPYDYFMLLPTALGIIGPYLSDVLDNYNISSVFQITVEAVIPLIGGIIAFYLRDKYNCDEKISIINKKERDKIKSEENPKQYSPNNMIYKAFSNAIITYSIASIIETILSFIPIIGFIVRIIQLIPVIGTLFSGMFYVIIYILVNMYNNIDAKLYCTSDGYGSTRKSITIFSSIIFLLILFKDILADKLGLGFLL